MNRVASDWSTTFASEKMVPQSDFDPETSISRWYNEKVWRAATAKIAQLFREGNTSTSVDVVKCCMSDFESDSSSSDDE